MADGDGEPRTTLQSQTELHGLQYLEDSDRTLSSLERDPLVRYIQKFKNLGGPILKKLNNLKNL